MTWYEFILLSEMPWNTPVFYFPFPLLFKIDFVSFNYKEEASIRVSFRFPF